jgi:virginiamycin B lyase
MSGRDRLASSKRACTATLVALLLFGLWAAALARPADAMSGTIIAQQAGPGSGFPVSVYSAGLDLAAGPNGAMWVLGSSGTLPNNPDGVERLSGDGTFRFFGADDTFRIFGDDQAVTGPDGAIWYTAADVFGTGLIVRVSSAGMQTVYRLPTGFSQPQAIVAGADGALWFTCPFGNGPQTCDGGSAIGRITTRGQMSFFPLPSDQLATGASPIYMADGPGGSIWFSVSLPIAGTPTVIDSIDTSGQITALPISVSGIEGMVRGRDGEMWFSDPVNNAIGRIDASDHVAYFPIPTAHSEPGSIIVGPDGALWFGEYIADKIGRITTTGRIAEYPEPVGPLGPRWLADGPKGTIWFNTDTHALGYFAPGSGPTIHWRTIYTHRPGPPPPVAPQLSGRLAQSALLRSGKLSLTLRFSRAGAVLVELSVYPRSLATRFQYRQTFTVRKGLNRLVLQVGPLATGDHELYVLPLTAGKPGSKAYLGRLVVS